MADIFLDTFTGTGTLATHVSDLGAVYVDDGSSHASDIFLSGGLAGTGAPSHAGGGKTTLAVPGTFSLEVQAVVGTIGATGYVILDFDIGSVIPQIQADKTTFYLDFGSSLGLVYPPYSAGSHTFRLDVTPTRREWFVDGVSVGFRTTAVSMAAPSFGFRLDNSSDNNDAEFRLDSLRMYVSAPPPLSWTQFANTVEYDS